jgi:hypothetical protein
MRLTSQPTSRTQRSANTCAVNHTRSQRYGSPSNADRAVSPSTRDARTKQLMKCYKCNGIGHLAWECPTSFKREENLPDRPLRRNPSRRSRRPGSPDEKPSHATRREAKRETKNSGNGVEMWRETAPPPQHPRKCCREAHGFSHVRTRHSFYLGR